MRSHFEMTSCYSLRISLALALVLLVKGIETVTINQVVISRDGDSGDVCSTSIQDGLQTIRESVKSVVDGLVKLREDCGDGLWIRVAHLNMSDPSQQCPSSWREYNTSGIRACGRPATSVGSCPSTIYSTNHQYNKVCGRVIGYQVASPDAFHHFQSDNSIDGFYMDGVSITHGSPRNHIWSFVCGFTQLVIRDIVCPCQQVPSIIPHQPPLFVGDNYYCETANSFNRFEYGHIFTDDKLWDGEQCASEGTCCTTKSPPWFSVELLNPTTDDIEFRICGSESTDNEDVLIELLEVYIQ